MRTIDQNSVSTLLRATHALVVTVDDVVAGDWSSSPDGGVVRTLEVTFMLSEVVKGETAQPPGATVRTTITQYTTGTGRIARMPGAWSPMTVAPGARFVVLAIAGVRDAAEILRDPLCLQVLPAADALVDLHVAAAVEDRARGAADACALAAPHAPRLGALFAEFLWARHAAAAVADERSFAPFADLLGLPTLGAAARGALVARLTTDLTNPEPPPSRQRARFAAVLLRLIAMPEAAALHDNIVGTYLPTTLGLGRTDELRAAEVFHDDPTTRSRAMQALGAYSGGESTAPLSAWIDR